MNDQLIIQEAISGGENAKVEFLDKVDHVQIGKVICSFLNADGGQLIVGVNDKRKVVGIDGKPADADKLHSFLVKELVPEAPVTVSFEQYNNLNLLVVRVWKGSNKPYIFQGAIYYRQDSKTIPATSKELSALIKSRQQEDLHWERQLSLNVELENIDFEEIKATIKSAVSFGRTRKDFSDNSDPLRFLEYYGLYQNGNFTNAATVLFAKEPYRVIPQCTVRVALLPDGKTGSHFSYDKIFEGNIFKNINAIEDFLDVNIGTSSSFKSRNWKRSDKLNYPKAAIREAILNAVIHRDYSSFSGSVLIAFYPDRLEISSYGRLPKGISLSSLQHSHLSIPVNPDIAQIVYLRGWIEKIGRGTIKILEDCKAFGLQPPVWSVENDVTTIVFKGISIVSSQSKKTSGNHGENDGLNDVVNDAVKKAVNDGVINGVNDGVKKQLIKVLTIIANNPGLPTPQIARIMRKAKPSIERYIRILREIELIEFQGAPKTGGYFSIFSRK